jgi:hypothetical protein
VIDDHLAIRFSLSFLDDRGVVGFTLLDNGGSLAVSIAMVRAYCDSGPNRANADTDANILRARWYCGA